MRSSENTNREDVAVPPERSGLSLTSLRCLSLILLVLLSLFVGLNKAEADGGGCVVDGNASLTKERERHYLTKARDLEARGSYNSARKCYAAVAVAKSSPLEQSLSAILSLAKLDNQTATNDASSQFTAWNVIKDLIRQQRLPLEIFAVPRTKQRIGNGIETKAESSRQECSALVDAQTLQPNLAVTYRLIGSIYHELKCYWEASVYFEAAANSASNEGAHLLVAEEYLKANEVEHAFISLRSMAQSLPNYLPARRLLTQLYDTIGFRISANIEDAPPPPSDLLLSIPLNGAFPNIIRKRYGDKDVAGAMKSCEYYLIQAGFNSGSLFCIIALRQELAMFLTDDSLQVERYLHKMTEEYTYMELIIPIQSLQLMDLPRTLVYTTSWGNFCSASWAEQMGGTQSKAVRKSTNKEDNKKIRIGYIGSEFAVEGPVSDHLRGVILYHNRDLFEVYLYPIVSPSTEPDSEPSIGRSWTFYNRICGEGKCILTSLTNLSTLEGAEQIKRDEIDILVNISGYGKKDTMIMTVSKPAPIQINFLGWPATLGANWYDYMISHVAATPAAYTQYFTEKMIYLPAGPFPSSHKLLYPDLLTPPNPSIPSRSSIGLPDDRFVFANFNRFFKIDRTLFERWMNILKSVPNSVLWLIEWDSLATNSIAKAAEQLGVSQSRIIFTPHVSTTGEHIRTLHLADLILDSWIYSGGITTLNCLWAGVPVLSLVGKTFAQRMSSASILSFDSQLALDHLLVLTPKEYEDRAVALATNKTRLAQIRKRVREGRESSALFDIESWVGGYERGLSMAWQRHLLSQPPDHITIT